MPSNLPNPVEEPQKELVSIREASRILGVSIDTLRRWDKEGKITSVRPNGKNRFFKLEDLEKARFSKKLSISGASNLLGISQTTLRRIEDKGLINPQRDGNGERVYDKESLDNFLHSEYFSNKKEVEEKILEPLSSVTKDIDEKSTRLKVINAVIEDEKQKVISLLHFRKRLFLTAGSIILICFVTVVILTSLFIKFPGPTARFLGLRDAQNNRLINDQSISASEATQTKNSAVLGAATYKREKPGAMQNLVRGILSPLTKTSLLLIQKLSPDVYEDVAPININDVLGVNTQENIDFHNEDGTVDALFRKAGVIGSRNANLRMHRLSFRITDDRPGILSSILAPFHLNGANLTAIDSMPGIPIDIELKRGINPDKIVDFDIGIDPATIDPHKEAVIKQQLMALGCVITK